MNIAIVDDCKNDRETLASYLTLYRKASFIESKITKYTSAEHFFESPSQFDIVFFDIFLGGMSGVEAAGKLRELDPNTLIVLVSASKDFIHESYDLKVLYYMLKPYNYSMFQKVMSHIEQSIKLSSILINIPDKIHSSFYAEDIVYVDVDRHYLQFHLKESIVRTYRLSFKEIRGELLKYPNFISCYRCVIVNMDHICKIDGRDFLLSSGDRLPIRRESFAKVKKDYAQYMFDRLRGEV